VKNNQNNLKQAWEEFKEKMANLRKRQMEIMVNISRKLDEQRLKKIRQKLQK
jgi:F0F1-type ATP synthase delta subunit